MQRPSAERLAECLRAPLAEALGRQYGTFQLGLLSVATDVPDGTTVLLLRDEAGRRRAVVLCSSPVAPDMVSRAMTKAKEARSALGPPADAPILAPQLEGVVLGLTFAVLPFCRSLSDVKPLWWIQRSLLRPRVFRWLRRVAERTVAEPAAETVETRFIDPLRRMSESGSVSPALRKAAARAARGLAAREWRPKHVLMHADLWKGNILLATRNSIHGSRGLMESFVVIDWAGSERNGYAIYDLVRLAQSLRLSDSGLRLEVEFHCRTLGCDPTNARSHLMAALANMAMNLEHFPVDRYTEMAESCLQSLDRVVG